MTRFKINYFLLLLVSGLIAVSCNNEDKDTEITPASADVTFKMNHTVDGQAVTLSDIMYTTAFGNPFSVERLQYFVSDFSLRKSDGTEYFFDMEQYVDGTLPATQSFSPSTKITQGTYDQVSFIFGINEEKNIPGRYTDPPESLMEWPLPLGGGYHYMKFEGKHDSAGVVKNFQAHSGPTNGNQNFIVITLPASIKVSGLAVTINIEKDLNKWFENPNTLDLNIVTGIMGNQEVQEKLKANGQDVFSLLSVE